MEQSGLDKSRVCVLDTNVLVVDPDCIEKLITGGYQVYLPKNVILELNKLKKDSRIGHIVSRVIDYLLDNPTKFSIIDSSETAEPFKSLVDTSIIREAQSIPGSIFITNDKACRLLARQMGVDSEPYKDASPFKSEAEYFSGFVSAEDEIINNCFMWREGKPVFYGEGVSRVVGHQNEVWKVRPRSVYQNLALELMVNTEIPLISIQSKAGYGKSYLALAAALYWVLEAKRHSKVYVIKPMIESSKELGFLPGNLDDKIKPYVRYMEDLLAKLHKQRSANKLFLKDSDPPKTNPHFFEMMPLNYMRGMNIDDAIVILDEVQNISRDELRLALTRMGENTRCFCLGDISQVDNPHLNSQNNGLNWIVKKLKGDKRYAHIVLNGGSQVRSRGPVTDLVIEAGL